MKSAGFRNDIAAASRADFTDGYDNGRGRRCEAGNQTLQVQNNRRCGDNRIDAGFRVGAVALFSVDINIKSVDSGVDCAVFQRYIAGFREGSI